MDYSMLFYLFINLWGILNSLILRIAPFGEHKKQLSVHCKSQISGKFTNKTLSSNKINGYDGAISLISSFETSFLIQSSKNCFQAEQLANVVLSKLLVHAWRLCNNLVSCNLEVLGILLW